MGKAFLGLDWTRIIGYVGAISVLAVAVWWSLNGRISWCEAQIIRHDAECVIQDREHAEDESAELERYMVSQERIERFAQLLRKLELENLTQHGLIRETLTEIRADVKHLRNGG